MGGGNTCGERERAKGGFADTRGGCKRGGWLRGIFFGGSSNDEGVGGRNKVTKFTTKYARWRDNDDGGNNKKNNRMVCKNERGL